LRSNFAPSPPAWAVSGERVAVKGTNKTALLGTFSRPPLRVGTRVLRNPGGGHPTSFRRFVSFRVHVSQKGEYTIVPFRTSL